MRIGLIDVDGHNFPNLALMKISAFHKQLDDTVEWYDGLLGERYDRVYVAKVFTESPDYTQAINADEIVYGGTGYGTSVLLRDKVENIYPDYGLYNVTSAYGYLTRGCPRRCPFCIVGAKEGYISLQVAPLSNFYKDQKEIVLLDPNILAYADADGLLQKLVETRAYIDFQSGLDIRFMTDDRAALLRKMKAKIFHFAWDNYEFKTYELLKYFRPLFPWNRRKLAVYVLVNFNTTMEQDLERIYKLRELQYDPFVMIYNKHLAEKPIKQMARWVNNKIVFSQCPTFEDYNKG